MSLGSSPASGKAAEPIRAIWKATTSSLTRVRVHGITSLAFFDTGSGLLKRLLRDLRRALVQIVSTAVQRLQIVNKSCIGRSLNAVDSSENPGVVLQRLVIVSGSKMTCRSAFRIKECEDR